MEELVRLLEEVSLSRDRSERATEAARKLCQAPDLTPWEDRLFATFHQIDDVTLLQAVADALAQHYLKRNRLHDLEKLLDQTRYQEYLLRGLESVEHPGPALGLIARRSVKIMAELLSKRPDLLRAGLDCAFREAPEQLPEILRELALFRRMPLNDALDLMLQLLNRGTPESRRATAHAFRLAAEAGADVSALSGTLASQADLETRRNLAYALALSACRTKDWAQLDELLESDAVQEGARKALYVAWVEQGLDLPEIATRVVRELPATESTFLEARRRGRQAQPDEEAILQQKEPSAALYWLLVGHPERAARFPQFPIAREIAAGTHKPACWICRNLPRKEQASHASSLAPEVKKFGLSLEGEPQHVRCPECGAPYLYWYEREYDDMDMWETFCLERKRPAPDPALLAHMDPNVRREGAWAMAAVKENLPFLLDSPHVEVREEGLLAVEPPLTPELLQRLTRLLEDPSLASQALRKVMKHYEDLKDYASLGFLLGRLPPRLQAEMLAGLTDPPPDLVRETALKLLGHEDRDIGRQAGYALERLPDLQPVLERIDELWNEAACGLWRDLAGKGAPVEGMMGRAAARLKNGPCTYPVLQGLEALARRKANLRPALEALTDLVERNPIPFFNHTLSAFSCALDSGEPAPRAIAALGKASRGRHTSRQCSSTLARASEKGHDMEPARADLENLMLSEDGWEREMAARAWTLHLLRRGSYEELAFLLGSALSSVPGAVAGTLEASGMDYAPLRGALESLARTGDGYARECAQKALRRIDQA